LVGRWSAVVLGALGVLLSLTAHRCMSVLPFLTFLV